MKSLVRVVSVHLLAGTVAVAHGGSPDTIFAAGFEVPDFVKPFAGAPACAHHDDSRFHELWDGLRVCHHDHTHNADPSAPEAIAVFGRPGYDETGRTISYPWQTRGDDGTENQRKHGGYKWLVELDLPVKTELNWDVDPPNAIRGIRAQYHFLSTARGTRTRLHSFWAEMQVCPVSDLQDCGIVRGGGIWDTGILHTPYKERWVPLPDQDPPDEELYGTIRLFGVDDAPPGFTVDPYRAHHRTCEETRELFSRLPDAFDRDAGSAYADTNRDNKILWTSAPNVFGYNHHLGLFVMVFDASDCANPDQIYVDEPLCDDHRCRFNGSEHLPFTLWAYVDPDLDGSSLDEDGLINGRVTFHGFTDRKGNIDTGCVRADESCVPYALENAPTLYAGWDTPVDNGKWLERFKDFDQSPDGEWWISGEN